MIPVPNDKKKVLLVDDDPTVLSAMKVVLRSRYELICVGDAETALTTMQSDKFDLYILDIKMPKHDGYWLYRAVRATGDMTRILFNSAYQNVLPPDDLKGALVRTQSLAKSGNAREFVEAVTLALAQP
jgi:CheY-like chemotaxis protein